MSYRANAFKLKKLPPILSILLEQIKSIVFNMKKYFISSVKLYQ